MNASVHGLIAGALAPGISGVWMTEALLMGRDCLKGRELIFHFRPRSLFRPANTETAVKKKQQMCLLGIWANKSPLTLILVGGARKGGV